VVAGREQLPSRDAFPHRQPSFCVNKKVTASQDDDFVEGFKNIRLGLRNTRNDRKATGSQNDKRESRRTVKMGRPTGAQQIPPLRSPGFPVELVGFGEPRAPSLRKGAYVDARGSAWQEIRYAAVGMTNRRGGCRERTVAEAGRLSISTAIFFARIKRTASQNDGLVEELNTHASIDRRLFSLAHRGIASVYVYWK
jgi:hypothetical protein